MWLKLQESGLGAKVFYCNNYFKKYTNLRYRVYRGAIDQSGSLYGTFFTCKFLFPVVSGAESSFAGKSYANTVQLVLFEQNASCLPVGGCGIQLIT